MTPPQQNGSMPVLCLYQISDMHCKPLRQNTSGKTGMKACNIIAGQMRIISCCRLNSCT